MKLNNMENNMSIERIRGMPHSLSNRLEVLK